MKCNNACMNIYRFLFSLITFFRYSFFKSIRINNSIVCCGSVKCKKSCTCRLISSYLKKTNINIDKSNNTCIIDTTLITSNIQVTGNNNIIEILCRDIIKDFSLIVYGNNCHVQIGEGTAINGAKVVCMGNGTKIIIGKHCLFASNINIWASDTHPIYMIDNISTPINRSRDIIINDHVWVGENATILKGVTLNTNSIVGMNTVVTKDVPCGTIVVGNPARVVKQGITWSRDHIIV